jgi:hypothetical protein
MVASQMGKPFSRLDLFARGHNQQFWRGFPVASRAVSDLSRAGRIDDESNPKSPQAAA